MSHPSAVGTVAGILTFVAMISSFLTAAYGDHIPTTRTHYAHSLSMFVVFAIYHHVFFTGALSMNWPSVLPAFWSNFAWSAGMIYWDSMQASINRLLGSNFGNTTAVGAASTGSSSESTGGGYDISKIYRRGLEGLFRREPSRFQDIVDNIAARENAPHSFAKRSLMNSTSGFLWYGNPVTPGLPLPGNYSGFAGTLSSHNIPASNAFMTGFLWFLILILIIGGAVVLFKWTLEGMSRFNMVKKDRLAFFRRYWVGFTALAIARMLFIGFFAMTFLTLFQFVYKGPVGVTVIAVLVFLIFFVGVLGISGLSVYYRLQTGTISRTPDRIRIEISKVLGCIPWIGFTRESVRSKQSTPRRTIGSLPWIKLTFVEHNGMHLDDVHHDERYIKRYGWLSARFRKSRWWFSVCWLSYELIRACFYGGAAGHPQVQVFGLLIVEIFGLILIVALKPFEGNRLNVFMVYLLGLSKVITVALSSAFDARFALPRILTTAIGVVIIVVQGLLLAALMIAILIGAVSSYMSLTRNRETFHPEAWLGLREKYFQHINRAATDRPRTPPPPPKLPEEPKATHFNVGTIKRLPKIEDDEDKEAGDFDPYGSRISVIGDDFHGVNYHRNSKGTSIHSNRSLSNLPFGARPHRSSWSSKDFVSYHESQRNSIMMSPVTSPLSLEARRSDPSLRDGYTIRPTSRAPSYGSGPTIEARRSRPSTKLGSSSHSSKPMLSEQPDEDTQSSKV